MSEGPFNVLGVPGSLRRGSYNRGLLRAAAELAPPGVEVQIFGRLGDIPPLDEDVEAQGDPEPVRALKDAIGAVDAVLIATPEYNYSIPGVLKNALDWAWPPYAESVLRRKGVAIMGASVGPGAAIRSQLALRQVLVFTERYALLKPEVLVSGAADQFDADGDLTDQPTRDIIRAQVEALLAWTRLLQSGRG
jgi:chromate reductase